MVAVQSATFQDWKNGSRQISFMADLPYLENRISSRFQATIITGRNGSHKSTLLKTLVTALTNKNEDDKVRLVGRSAEVPHLVCMSGSVADRFPLKESGGRSTEVDIPQYVYLGQRAGANLLSKRKPIETMLAHMLDKKKSKRTAWGFFRKAHELVGILPHVEYELSAVNRTSLSKSRFGFNVQVHIEMVAAGNPYEQSRPFQGISRQTAIWLLNEFDREDFSQLDKALRAGARRISVRATPENVEVDSYSISAIRLGLLTGLLILNDTKIISLTGYLGFTANELSSGEYHLFTSLLGLGFSIEEGSVVLIDEPENSLHPQWQKEFMETVIEICNEAASGGHLIISTHSPLIVGAAPAACTIVDLSDDSSTSEAAPYGASADEVLLTKFGVGSSRNRYVVEVVQRAISYVERADFENPDFLEMAGELKFIRNSLKKNDPLVIVINALLDEEQE